MAGLCIAITWFSRTTCDEGAVMGMRSSFGQDSFVLELCLKLCSNELDKNDNSFFSHDGPCFPRQWLSMALSLSNIFSARMVKWWNRWRWSQHMVVGYSTRRANSVFTSQKISDLTTWCSSDTGIECNYIHVYINLHSSIYIYIYTQLWWCYRCRSVVYLFLPLGTMEVENFLISGKHEFTWTHASQTCLLSFFGHAKTHIAQTQLASTRPFKLFTLAETDSQPTHNP